MTDRQYKDSIRNQLRAMDITRSRTLINKAIADHAWPRGRIFNLATYTPWGMAIIKDDTEIMMMDTCSDYRYGWSA